MPSIRKMLFTSTGTYRLNIDFFAGAGGITAAEQKKCLNAYAFGFNGKEKDDEVSGSGNQYDYGFRIYNPRLGRFLSVDPLSKSYPWYTPYQFAGNSPIANIDLDGREPDFFMTGIMVGYAVSKVKNPNSSEIVHYTNAFLAHPLVEGTIVGAFAPFNMLANTHASGNAKDPAVKQYYANQAALDFANVALGYMAGAAFKQLVRSVGTTLGSETAATAATNKNLFRGDTRSPQEIFESGFQAKGKNASIPDYVEANESSVFVGTSKSATEAAKKARTGYVYSVENTGKGLDVNNYYKAIEGRANPYFSEQEVIFDQVIPSSQIRGAYPVIDGEIDFKGFISNPSYRPPSSN